MRRDTLQLVVSSTLTDMVAAGRMDEEPNMKDDIVDNERIGTLRVNMREMEG